MHNKLIWIRKWGHLDRNPIEWTCKRPDKQAVESCDSRLGESPDWNQNGPAPLQAQCGSNESIWMRDLGLNCKKWSVFMGKRVLPFGRRIKYPMIGAMT